MRKSLLTSLALSCCAFLGLVAFGAHAMPIHTFNLLKAGGSPSYTFTYGDPQTLTLSGWEYDSGVWTSANMVSKCPAGLNAACDNNTVFTGAETGVGVACNSAGLSLPDQVCNQHEIGTTPWQMIDANISGLSFSSITISLGSVNGTGTGGYETAYVLGANCQVGGGCTYAIIAGGQTGLNACTDYGTGGSDTCSFTFTPAELTNSDGNLYSDIWITPSLTDQSCSNTVSPPDCNNANILMGGQFTFSPTTVPEPAELGIFGLGILLIGLFVGLRRRQTH
ncbi:MAG: PEP-CTERM sorting domain-containing protein [Gammaproteobacteria bacterium]